MEGCVDLGTAISVKPVPKAAYSSDFRENADFCLHRDSILVSLAPPASVLPLDHCDLSSFPLPVLLFLRSCAPYM